MCPSALIVFFVFGAVLCGPLGRIRSGRGVIFFDGRCGIDWMGFLDGRGIVLGSALCVS